jgi:hypothetical protein
MKLLFVRLFLELAWSKTESLTDAESLITFCQKEGTISKDDNESIKGIEL